MRVHNCREHLYGRTSLYELPRVGIRNWGGQSLRTLFRIGWDYKQKSADFLKGYFRRRLPLQTKAPALQLTEPTILAGLKPRYRKLCQRQRSTSAILAGRPIKRQYGILPRLANRSFLYRAVSARHRGDICGRCLKSGRTGTLGVWRRSSSASNVVDVRAENPQASIIADLKTATNIPSDSFDCIILTQVLIYMDDVEAALATVLRILKPGGVALITVPGISQICSDPEEASKWNWSFYPRTFQRLLAKFFDPKKLIVEGYGNLKTTIGFLAGLAQEDMASDDYLFQDHRYPLIVAARATKPDACLDCQKWPALGISSGFGRDAGIQLAPFLARQ